MTTTVVTAFYPIRSKFSPQQYLEWAQRFLQLNAPIVLFTEPHLVSTFQSMRSFLPLHIIARPFGELDMWVLYEAEWRKQHAMDREAAYHSPELYALWAQKSVFVAEAIHENPFNTEYYYWCDIGAFRDPNISAAILTSFPKSAILKMISPAILLNSVAPMRAEEWAPGTEFKENRIVGGLWGGSVNACLRWRAAYEVQLLRYFQAGRFAGKDQSVMLSAYLEDTTLACVARPTVRDGDHWFFQQYLLGANAPFEQDMSYMRPVGPPAKCPMTVKLMGGLGNQMFQLAAAYAHAQRVGARLVLAAEKDEADGRPMYWATAFHRFQHFLQRSVVVKPAHWEAAATVYSPLPRPSALGLRLQGYFQSPKYFSEGVGSDASEELRRLFSPHAEVVKRIRKEHSELLAMKDRVVVVHARRGDYLKAVEHHGVLPLSYYRSGMEAMAATVKDPFFLLVCEEPLWWMDVLEELPLLQTHPFQILMESDEVVTMGLLQQFQHFVIANSSFSWWAAWLANAADVVAPRNWFGPAGPKEWKDIYMPHWRLL